MEKEGATLFADLHLETERLILRAYTMKDLPDLHAIVSQEEVMKNLPEGVMSLEQTEKVLRWKTPKEVVDARLKCPQMDMFGSLN